MDSVTFTVFFEDPFWVGIFERTDVEGYSVSRVVFGPEPTDTVIFNFLFENYPNNVHFSCPINDAELKKPSKKVNPKRRQRDAAALLAKPGSSTKSQAMVKHAYEEHKQETKHNRTVNKNLEAELKYQIKLNKKKNKKRGR